MPTTRLRIATRKSPLALWQAEHVAARLRALYPTLEVALVGKVTQGDKLLDSPLAKVGGKGLFVKELEQSLLAGEADIAVHSMKDVPVEIPEGLAVPVILAREDPRDAFVSNYPHPDALPSGARIGTSSLRRQCQWSAQYPDWQVLSVRGNVGSRLAKLDSGAVDALFLAAAGLKRLGLEDRITLALAPEWSLPAIGQGAIGIECRANDPTIHAMIAPLDDVTTHQAVAAERALNTRLQGGCQVPIAGYAVVEGTQLWLRGLVGAPDGSLVIRDELRGPVVDAALLGTTLAERLLALGAGEILRDCGMG